MTQHIPFLINEHQLIDYIQAQGRYILRREIARAFDIKANDKHQLKELLNNLEQQRILKRRGKSYCAAISKSLATVKVINIDEEGIIRAELVESQSQETQRLNTVNGYTADKRLSVGDRLIIDISNDKKNKQIWTFIRKLIAQPILVCGLVKKLGQDRFILQSISHKSQDSYPLTFEDPELAVDDALIEAHLDKTSSGQIIARATALLKGQESYSKQLSLIAIHKYDLPQEFSKGAILLAQKAKLPPLKGRTDIRHLPLVTIDDHDARDHDDAVYCEPITDTADWRLIVAIADVSHFVHINDALDHDALARGNSVYFPDQVLPMLPEQLSNNLCSLKPNVDRPAVVADMVIDSYGRLKSYQFYAAMMRSWGKLTYQGVQQIIENDLRLLPKNLDLKHIQHLYTVYNLLKSARAKRGTLDFDLPEKKVNLDNNGNIISVLPRQRLESNQLIEEMMITANVAAAQYLSMQAVPPLYRIHDEPKQDRLEDLRLFLGSTALSLPRGQALKPKNFNNILTKSKDLDQGQAIHELILRAQSQAQYSPDNIGHFGLNLPQYCHFTSPIRRYADLIVHRAIKSKIAKNPDLYPYDHQILEDIGQEISDKERRAAKAERNTIERYIARHLEPHVGEMLTIQIKGITPHAVFVSHPETGADGILPLRNMIGDFFNYLPHEQIIKGRRTGQKFRLGDTIKATLNTTNWITGSLVFSLKINSKKKSTKNNSKTLRKSRIRPKNKRNQSK